MLIGIPKEVKNHEYRVGATPAMVRALVKHGHTVRVETQAGKQIGFPDEMYELAQAKIVGSPLEIYQADMVIKVKEPQESEYPLLREEQILFCFLHLAPDLKQTQQLLKNKVVGIACETITDEQGRLPILIPMSEIAGRLSILVGANCMQLTVGGNGTLLSGVPGVPPARAVIIGGGAAGTEAARMALGVGADVTVIDININRLRELDALYGPQIKTVYSTSHNIEEAVIQADLVIGAVLIPGKVTPKLVTRSMIKKMTPGSVLVDVSIDQGGCFETSFPTTHAHPTFVAEGIVHYCVTNMPGAYARTSTMALTNASIKYALTIANKGWRQAVKENPGIRDGLNVCLGRVTNASVATDLGLDYIPPETLVS